MTGTALRSLVRDLVGVDAGYTRLGDSAIDAYVDEAMHRLAVEAMPLSLQGSTAQNLTASTSQYTVSAPVLFIQSIVANGVTLTPISYAQLNDAIPSWRSTGAGASNRYVIEGVDNSGYYNIRLYPTPGTTVANGLISYYVKEPTSLVTITTGEIVQWPEFIHNAFGHFAAWRFLKNLREAGGKDPRIAEFKATWDELRGLYIDREQRLQGQRWGNISVQGWAGGYEDPWGNH